MEKIDYNALGQCIDSTWGKSSTNGIAIPTYSIKFKLQASGLIEVNYSVMVTFGTEAEMVKVKRRQAEDSIELINKCLAKIKTNYKEITSSGIAFKEVSSVDSLNVINMNFYNPRRTAIYKRLTLLEMK